MIKTHGLTHISVVIAFEKQGRLAGKAGGITHFGFRLKSPKDMAKAVAAVP